MEKVSKCCGAFTFFDGMNPKPICSFCGKPCEAVESNKVLKDWRCPDCKMLISENTWHLADCPSFKRYNPVQKSIEENKKCELCPLSDEYDNCTVKESEGLCITRPADSLLTDERIAEKTGLTLTWVRTYSKAINKIITLAFDAGRESREAEITAAIKEIGVWSRKAGLLEAQAKGDGKWEDALDKTIVALQKKIKDLEAQALKDQQEKLNLKAESEALRVLIARRDEQHTQALSEAGKQGAGELALLAKEVMDLLQEKGASIVPHLLDTDENPAERLRIAVSEILGQSKLKEIQESVK